MKPFSLQWMITKEWEGMFIREFLSKHHISRRTLINVKFEGGTITLNGNQVNVKERLKSGDVLTVDFPIERRSDGMLPDDMTLCIVYEDDYVLVIEKPAGMNTIPSREHPRRSLANGITAYYEKNEIPSTVHIVTRLDRDTSGLVLVAKNRYIHHLFGLQQQQRMVKRMYEAFAEGVFVKQTDTVEFPIGRKDTSIIEREVREDGQYACTRFQVLEQFREYAHLSLTLETGRTHQIRVHMSHIDHPLVGDDLYGGSRQFIDRQALHCCSLAFFHPIKEEWFQFTSSLPNDLQQLLEL